MTLSITNSQGSITVDQRKSGAQIAGVTLVVTDKRGDAMQIMLDRVAATQLAEGIKAANR